MNWQEELSKITRGELRLSEPLSSHTSFRIGGPADIFVVIKNTGQLKEFISFCKAGSIPFLIIGRGTNLLVSDEGFRGVVIQLGGDFANITFNNSLVEAGAAVALSRLSRLSAKKGLSGLEFAFGIPGSLGGALIMNAGSSSHSISEVADSVEALDRDGNVALVTRDKLKFGYRWSNLSEYVALTKAYLQMKHCPPEEALELMQQIFNKKKSDQPLSAFSAGCVFKNPPGMSAGKLIDECGLKGEKIGDAQVSTRHANFIINAGKAKASDVIYLIDKVRAIVKDRKGIELELELKIISNENAAENIY